MAQTLSGLIQVKITGDAKELLRVLQTVKRELAGIGAEVKKKPLSEGFLKLKQTLNTVNNVASKVTNTLLGMRSILGMIAVGVVGKSILDTALTFNKWNASLEALTGSATESLRVQEMLKQQAKELGQRYVVLIEQYTKFRGAAEMAGMKLQDVEKIFRSVSKAAVVFQLDAKDTYEVFRALTQMLSKGTISAEELRGQFGERIPGALAIMADSLGISLGSLLKLMEDGELLADVVLPKMGEGLEKTFGGRVIKVTQTAQAEINRFMNVIDELKNRLAVSGALDKFTDIIKQLGDYLLRAEVTQNLSEMANGLMILIQAMVKFTQFLMSLPREVFAILFGVLAGSMIGGPIGAVVGGVAGGVGAYLTRYAEVELPKIVKLSMEIEKIERSLKNIRNSQPFRTNVEGLDISEELGDYNVEEGLKAELAKKQQEYQELLKSEGGGFSNANQMKMKIKEKEEEIRLMRLSSNEQREISRLEKKRLDLQVRLGEQIKLNNDAYLGKDGKGAGGQIFDPDVIKYTMLQIEEAEVELEQAKKRAGERQKQANDQLINLQKQVASRLLAIESDYLQSKGDKAKAYEIQQNEIQAKGILEIQALRKKDLIDQKQYDEAKLQIEKTTQNNIAKFQEEKRKERLEKHKAEIQKVIDTYNKVNEILQKRAELESRITDVQNRRANVWNNPLQNKQFEINQQTLAYQKELTESQAFSTEQITALVTRYRDELEKLADQELFFKIGQFFTDHIVDPLMQAVEGTKSLKDAFREMTVSILRDLSRLAMRQAFMNMFGAIFSGAGGMTTAGGTTNMGGGQFMGAGGTAFGMGSAAGNVFNRGNVTAFANGTVISKPTMFPMRGGVGLMGENGPEAIMPLQRGRNGKLGVAGGGITMTNNIVIENGGQMAEDPEKMNKFVTKIGEEIRNQVRAVMVDEQRVNGIFNSPAIRRYA